MSRFTYSRIRPYSVRDVARVNAFWDDFEAATVSVNGDNLAEEGLDRLAFSVRPGVRLKTVNDNTRIALAPIGAWTTFAMGLSFRTSSVGAVTAKDALRITSVVYFESLPSGGAATFGLPANELVQMRHQYNDNGSVSAVSGSTAKLTGGPGGASALGRHGTIAIESWITGGATDLQWVELAYQLSGATNAYPSKALLVLDKFRSTKVV